MRSEVGVVVLWFACYVGLGALAAPAAALLCRRLGDRGAGLAIPLALAVVGVVGYWLGRLSFGPLTTVAAIACLAGASSYARARGARVDWRRYGEVVAVFAAGFGLVVAIRAVDPSVVAIAGEKYLDYGLLNGLYRAETLPPEDPWFAGERVRYYYGGYVVAAALGRLLGTPSHFAYNLALAGTYGAFVAATYGLAGSIARERGVDRVRAGLLAAFFVGLASNLATPIRLLAWLAPGGHAVAERLGIPLTRGGGRTVAHGLESFGYWDASRLIPGTINEFPFFSFLNGDLHPHLLSLPFLLLFVGVWYEYWRTPEPEVSRRRLLAFVVGPALAGWLAVVNAWDFPTALGLSWLVLALAPATPWSLLPEPIRAAAETVAIRPRGAEASRPLVAAGIVGIVAVAGVLFVLPFVLGAAGTGGRSVATVAERSEPVPFLLVHGAFLFVAAWYLTRRVDTRPDVVGDGTVALAALAITLLWALEALPFAFVLPVVLAGWYLVRTERAGFETLLFVAGAGLVATVEVLYVVDGSGGGRLNTVFKTYVHVWTFWSLAAGVALAGALERRPTLAEDERATAEGSPARAEATNLEVSTDGGDEPGERDGPDGTDDGGGPDEPDGSVEPVGSNETGGIGSTPSRRTAAVALVLCCSLGLYAGLALVDHADGRVGPTLDARYDLQEREPDVAAAFDWLDDREGQPRIVEAPTPAAHTYGSTDAAGNPPPSSAVTGASTFTGLPTVAGWTHSAYYHGEEAYEARVAEAESVFEGSDAERAAVLDAYEVRYVFVGPNERAWYDLALEDDDALEVAATFGDVTIYEVDRTALE